MSNNKYINNVSALQFYQLARFGFLVLVRILFSKAGLLPEEIGQIEYFLFLGGALTFFWVSGLIQSLLPLNKNSKTFGKSTGKKSPELFNSFLVLSLFSFLGGILLCAWHVSGLRGGVDYLPLILLFVVFSGPSFLVEYIYLMNNLPGKILAYALTMNVVQILLVAMPVYYHLPVEYILWGFVLSAGIRFIWLLSQLFKYAEFRFSVEYIKEHLYLGSPLIVSALLGGSAQYLDGFLIKLKFDDSQFAIFSYGAKELPIAYLMANALSNSMVSLFGGESELKNILATIKEKSARLMHVLFPVSIVFLFSSHYIFPRIFNPDFSDSAIIFNIYLLLLVSRVVFPQTVLIGLKETSLIMKVSMIELFVNVVLSVLFIFNFGIAGVAYATVVAYYSEKLMLAFLLKKKYKLSVSSYCKSRLLLYYSLGLIVAFLLVEFII